MALAMTPWLISLMVGFVTFGGEHVILGRTSTHMEPTRGLQFQKHFLLQMVAFKVFHVLVNLYSRKVNRLFPCPGQRVLRSGGGLHEALVGPHATSGLLELCLAHLAEASAARNASEGPSSWLSWYAECRHPIFSSCSYETWVSTLLFLVVFPLLHVAWMLGLSLFANSWVFHCTTKS